MFYCSINLFNFALKQCVLCYRYQKFWFKMFSKFVFLRRKMIYSTRFFFKSVVFCAYAFFIAKDRRKKSTKNVYSLIIVVFILNQIKCQLCDASWEFIIGETTWSQKKSLLLERWCSFIWRNQRSNRTCFRYCDYLELYLLSLGC